MAINKIDMTQVNETLQATFQKPMWLTTNADDTTLALAAGTVEDVGGYLYRVDGGVESVVDSGVADGTAYIYIRDPGTGVATAELLADVPAWRSTEGGYYNGTGKAIFVLEKSGTTYSKKQRLGYINGNRINGDLVVVNKITAAFSEAKRSGNFVSTGVSTGLVESDLYVALDGLFGGETGDRFPCGGSVYDRTNGYLYILSGAIKPSSTTYDLSTMRMQIEETEVVTDVINSPFSVSKKTIYNIVSSGGAPLISAVNITISETGTNSVYWSLTA